MGLYESLPENSYIKKLLLGIDETFAERFLQMKKNYESATDKEDKTVHREKLLSLFWELYPMVARMINPELSTAKRLFLRYGLADLRYLSSEDQKFILNQPIIPPDYQNDVIFYADEWLQGILEGKLKASRGDETAGGGKTPPVSSQHISAKQEKHVALLKVENSRFESFKKNRSDLIQQLNQKADHLKEDYEDSESSYEGVFSQSQNQALDEISDFQKEIKKLNKEITVSVRTMAKAQQSLDEIREEESSGYSEIEETISSNKLEDVLSEVKNIRQMAKMTVGRQGNAFPFLTSGFLPKETKAYLFKETLKKKLNHWLELDPEAFQRTYKSEVMNIMPYMILVPGYGVTGVCWESLDKNNKQFGRGRIALPIFTRSPDLSLLSAIGDLRWQAAKEIASYYWMEEGLTGHYYGYSLEAKLKGDLRILFITDYLLWMTKETQGIQKLEQSARYVFWRYVPLNDDDKIRLSKKGYYYNQLWEKEQIWRQNKDK